MKYPRIMLAAASSGSGKTLITCGILQALINRQQKTASFKCGPDYIDPMFHSKIIGAKARNLDTYFTDDNLTRYLFCKTAKTADISILEGVMGFYDGILAADTRGSSYELAKVTDTPVILIVNCHGMSLSIVPMIQGFLQFREDSRIKGVILNQITKGLYEEIKNKVEEDLKLKVFGYVPYVEHLCIESRHLGLVTPDEIAGLHAKLDNLGKLFEETIAMDELIQMAEDTPEIYYHSPQIPQIEGKPVIAVARDEAFCFYYEDNLELLRTMGANLIMFSPLYDRKLPHAVDGILLGGGYPELYAEALSKNTSMIESIRNALSNQMPCLAECGGFMYLHQTMEDMKGNKYPMIGFLEGEAYHTDRLQRFGYATLTAKKDQMIAEQGEAIRGHEYHYFDSTHGGDSFLAEKPSGKNQWECIWGNRHLAVGYPHLYYYSNPNFPYRFLQHCILSKQGYPIGEDFT